MVVGDRDAEHAIFSQARGETLEEPFAIEGQLARAGKPRRFTGHVGKQRFGAQAEREGRRREGQPSELLARDGKDEIGFSLGRREIEHHASARPAPMIEHELEALHARAARAHRAFEFREQSAQRKKQRFDAVGFRGELETRAKSRRRRIGFPWIGKLSHEAVERSDDLGTEALGDAFRRKLEHVAQPQHAEIGQVRESLPGPVEEKEREIGEALAKVGERDAGAHLQAPRFGAREEARRERRGRDAEGGMQADLAHAALDRARELRVPLEELQACLDLEDDALPVDAHHRRELPGPCGEPLERFPLDAFIPRQDAQASRERLRRGYRLAFTNARAPCGLIGARHQRPLHGALGNHERLARGARALRDLQGQ